jgi:hypothetical protein
MSFEELRLAKRRTPRQRKAAAEAARREAHAKLVVKRSADPRYVHREASGDGYVISAPSGPATDELQEALQGQGERFRQQFGREMGPDDPLIWNEDANEPTPITEAQMRRDLDEWAENVVAAGLDPSPVLAMRDLGYIVTEETQHLFSLAELDAFADAVAYYRRAPNPLGAPPFRSTDPPEGQPN